MSINVTLKSPLGDGNRHEIAAFGEYKGGRVRTMRGRCDIETEHFNFEWIAPADHRVVVSEVLEWWDGDDSKEGEVIEDEDEEAI